MAKARGRGRPIKTEHVGASERTKDLLTKSAKKLFSRYGFDGTTVKDIADEAGVNISLISYHFDGKEGLYQSCVANHGQDRLDMAKKILKEPKNKDEFRLRLEMFLDEAFRGYVSEPELDLMAFREAEVMSSVVTKKFRKTYVEFFDQIMKFMELAQKNSILRDDLKPQLAAACFFGIIMHFIRMDEIRKTYYDVSIRDEEYREYSIQQIIDLLLLGILKKPS